MGKQWKHEHTPAPAEETTPKPEEQHTEERPIVSERLVPRLTFRQTTAQPWRTGKQ